MDYWEQVELASVVGELSRGIPEDGTDIDA